MLAGERCSSNNIEYINFLMFLVCWLVYLLVLTQQGWTKAVQ